MIRKVSLQILAVLPPAQLREVTERMFQFSVVEYAKQRGWKVHFATAAGTPKSDGSWRGTALGGWPDLFLCRGSHARAYELKSEKGRPSSEQREWLEALEIAGIQAGVYRPSQAGELMEMLK